MDRSILKSKPKQKIKQTRDFNIPNGNDAEIFSASLLLSAIGAEISWGSRNEDGRKIDLICSYDHPWFDKERLIFLVQVKSGDSFGEKLHNGFKLKTNAKQAAQRTSHPICLIWVHRDSNSSFWAYIHPNSTNQTQTYGNNHELTPPMRFDIARCQAKYLPVKLGGSGIIITDSIGSLKDKRKIALTSYRKYSEGDIICPNLGRVEFTRIGWRHMFRKTRSAEYKNKSLAVINYLDKILIDKPSDTYISKFEITEQSDFKYRNCEYVLIYNQVKYFNRLTKTTENIKVVVRLMEEIMWPVNWNLNSTLTQSIDRRLVLLSCYYK